MKIAKLMKIAGFHDFLSSAMSKIIKIPIGFFIHFCQGERKEHILLKIIFLLISRHFHENHENEHFFGFGAESCPRGWKVLFPLGNINGFGESFSLQNWKKWKIMKILKFLDFYGKIMKIREIMHFSPLFRILET